MLISTKGRYALRVMIDLAEHQADGFIPLKVIAQRQEISEKYLENIIKLLVKAKLLTGVRGKGGGYQLAKPAAECTAGEILRATENALAPVSCQGLGDGGCPRGEKCPTLPMWRELNGLIQDYFDRTTLAHLAQQARELEDLGFDGLPVCMAKTQYSFSDDATLLGAPKGFTITVRNLKVSAGAGFLVALTGDIMTMPGLPKVPAAEKIDVDEHGRITGLF